MSIIVRILSILPVTHDVKCFRLEKPEGYRFVPGQATDVAINEPGLENELRPFTFTALSDQPYLEFTIKRYPAHNGVTNRIHELMVGDELIIHDPWGAIEYKGAGYFIAGGAGITPFMAILRDLHRQDKLQGNTLYFSNKTSADVIYNDELKAMLGQQAVLSLTKEKKEGFNYGRIDEDFIRKHMDPARHFYICGPDEMVAQVSGILQKSGVSADTIVFEK